MTKIHTLIKNKCEYCDFSDQDKIKLRKHIQNSHKNNTNCSMSTDTTVTGTFDSLTELEKVSWEEKRIDDEIMDTKVQNPDESDEMEIVIENVENGKSDEKPKEDDEELLKTNNRKREKKGKR